MIGPDSTRMPCDMSLPPEYPEPEPVECRCCGAPFIEDYETRYPICTDCSDGVALIKMLHQEPDPLTAYLQYGLLLQVYGMSCADAADYHFEEADFRDEMGWAA